MHSFDLYIISWKLLSSFFIDKNPEVERVTYQLRYSKLKPLTSHCYFSVISAMLYCFFCVSLDF